MFSFIAGLGMVTGATRIFRRIGTNARPSQPTLALATSGVFSWARNPNVCGRQPRAPRLAIGFALDWVLLLVVVSLPLVHYRIMGLNRPTGLLVASVPEPSTWSMIAVGGVALLGIMLRKKHRTA